MSSKILFYLLTKIYVIVAIDEGNDRSIKKQMTM